MKNYNLVEIVLFSKYSSKDSRFKELERWLGTTAQTVIAYQHKRVKKIHLKTFMNTPAIYLS